jgi:cytochrome c peroxidase
VRVWPRAFAIVTAALVVGPLVGRGEEPPTPRPERSQAERSALAQRLRGVYGAEPAAWPASTVDAGVEWKEVGLLPKVVHPADNPWSAAKADLGRMLFFDARLSAGRTLACASCHEPNLGWADGRAVSQPRGHGPGRNAPTIRNAVHQPTLFWDGRVASLEQQAREALTNPLEMDARPEDVVALLEESPDYRDRYAGAFPGEPITLDGVVRALACFERTVVGGRSRFDAFLDGDTAALSDAEVLGLDLFRREARCMNCHHGPAFSDGRFHDLGLSFYGRSREDRGRMKVTGNPGDSGRFRTPSLRDVTRTTPLMHTGAFELRGVLNMYNAGMVTLKRQPHQHHDAAFPVKSRHLRPLGLNRQDLDDLAAFLGSLEEPRHRVQPPALPPRAPAAPR